MKDLEICSKMGNNKARQQAVQDYSVYHAHLVQAYPQVAQLWPASINDVYAEGEYASAEAAKAWQIAGQKGVDSMEYRMALSRVTACAPPGLPLNLPPPQYHAKTAQGLSAYPQVVQKPVAMPSLRQAQNLAVTADGPGRMPPSNNFGPRPTLPMRASGADRYATIKCWTCNKFGHPQFRCDARKVAIQNGWVYEGILRDENGFIRRELRWQLPDPQLKDKPVLQDPATGSVIETILKVVREAKLLAEGQSLSVQQVAGADSGETGPFDYQPGEQVPGEDYEYLSYAVAGSGGHEEYAGELLQATEAVSCPFTLKVNSPAHGSGGEELPPATGTVFMAEAQPTLEEYVPDLTEEEYNLAQLAQKAMVYHLATNWKAEDYDKLAAFAVTRSQGPEVRNQPYPQARPGIQPIRSSARPVAGTAPNPVFPPWPRPAVQPPARQVPYPAVQPRKAETGNTGSVLPAKTQGFRSIAPKPAVKKDSDVVMADAAAKAVPGKAKVAAKTLSKAVTQPYSKFRLRECELTKGIDWRAVCEKIVYTHALRDGQITTLEVLCISPILGKFFEQGLRQLQHGKEPEGYQTAVAYLAEIYPEGKDVSSEEESPAEDFEQSAGDSEAEAGVAFVSEAHTNASDRELLPLTVHEVAVNQQFPQATPPLQAGELWNEVWEGPLPLTVRTVLLEAKVAGQKCRVIVDDGSQLNMVSKAFYDKINQSQPLAIRVDISYTVTGVHGSARPLSGFFEADLVFGGLTTRQVFWVNQDAPEDMVFLGMPFILRNQVNFYWSGNRRILQQNTEFGRTELAIHPRDGPLITVLSLSGPRKTVALRLEGLRQLNQENSAEVNQAILVSNAVTVTEDTASVCPAWIEEPEELMAMGYMTLIDEPQSPGKPRRARRSAEDGNEASGEESDREEAGWQPPDVNPALFDPIHCGHEDCRFVCWINVLKHYGGPRGSVPMCFGRCGHLRLPAFCPECELVAADEAHQQAAEHLYDSLFPQNADREELRVDSLTIVDNATGTTEVLTGDEEPAGPASVAGDVGDTSPDGIYPEGNATVFGMYKPVHKKKRPVDTVMLESDKPQMRLPDDLLADLPAVNPKVGKWEDLKPGKRLNAERLAEVKETLDKEGF
jgi:hypothetical protein